MLAHSSRVLKLSVIKEIIILSIYDIPLALFYVREVQGRHSTDRTEGPDLILVLIVKILQEEEVIFDLNFKDKVKANEGSVRREIRQAKYSNQKGGCVPRRPDMDMNIAFVRKFESTRYYHYTPTRKAKIIRTRYTRAGEGIRQM